MKHPTKGVPAHPTFYSVNLPQPDLTCLFMNTSVAKKQLYSYVTSIRMYDINSL